MILLDRLREQHTAARLHAVLFALAWATLVLVVLNLSILQIIGVLLAAGAGAGLVLRPVVGVVALIGLRVWIDLLWFLHFSVLGLHLTELYAGVGVIGLGLLLLMQTDRVGRHPAVLWSGALAILMTVATVRVGAAGVPAFLRVVSPVLLLLVVSTYLRDPDVAWRYLGVFALLGAVAVGRSTWSVLTHTDYSLLAGTSRLVAGYQNATNHALILTILSQVGMFWAVVLKGKWRVAAVIYTLFALMAVRESYNRSAIVAFATFLVLFLILERRWQLLGFMMPLVLLVVGFNGVMQDRFAAIFSASSSISSSTGDIGSGRWGLWTSSLDIWTSSPAYDLLLGLGANRHFIGHGWMEPHNDYLAITYQAGPFATLAVVVILAGGVVYAMRGGRHAHSERERLLAHFAAAVTVAGMITSGVTNGFISRSSPAWYMFAITGIGYAMGLRAAQRTPVATPSPADAPPDSARSDA